MDYLALRPRWRYRLKRGLPLGIGDETSRVIDRTGELPEWDGQSYSHQSNARLIWQLIIEAKSQRVWTAEQTLAALLDVSNLGGAWLRRQDDPVAKFSEMWPAAVQHDPRWSVEQAVQLVLALLDAEPGAQLWRLRDAVGGNRGDLDKWLDELVERGEIREERTYGPSGVQVTSRRFWRTPQRSNASVARALTTAVSLSLLGLAAAQATHSAKGQMVSEGGRLSAGARILRDKRLREIGRRRWRWMAAKRREAAEFVERMASKAARRDADRRQASETTHRLDEHELTGILAGVTL